MFCQFMSSKNIHSRTIDQLYFKTEIITWNASPCKFDILMQQFHFSFNILYTFEILSIIYRV